MMALLSFSGRGRGSGGGSAAMGGATLLLCFSVLCLTVFALLTLNAARAEEKLSLASTQALSDYYRADSQAEALVARIEQLVATGEQLPSCLDGVELEMADAEGASCGFTLPVNASLGLSVELAISDKVCSVRQWRLINDYDWLADDSIKLLELPPPEEER